MNWRRSSFSGDSGDCVEVRQDLTALRDSKQADGPELPTPAFRDLLRTVKAGQFDR
ncbi:MAG: DUF397 domain-containing protein [Actinophytocola sp.]|uniref:DUF397 domain-containing protein n=1 Tax=Actinophytocola sp. TaxID=1872138 RepID=UPI003C74E941